MAVLQPVVIDDERCPIGRVMTGGAVLAGVVLGCFVATGAVGVAGVVEHGRFPILNVMASGTFKMVVGCRIIFPVTG